RTPPCAFRVAPIPGSRQPGIGHAGGAASSGKMSATPWTAGAPRPTIDPTRLEGPAGRTGFATLGERCMTIATKTDVGMDGWMIDHEIFRLREWASDRSHPMPDDLGAEVTIGSSEACSLRLSDPSGSLSRQHARLERDGTRWIARDLDSKNGLRLDGIRRPK